MSDKSKPMSLSEADLVLLKNALNEILNGPNPIEAWEFQLRTGVERGDALKLLERLELPRFRGRVVS